MKKSFVQKAAAVACSAATLAAMSIAAISASAASANDLTADQLTVKASDKHIAYTVKLTGTEASSFDTLNFSIKYDSRLKPAISEDAPNVPEFDCGYSGMASPMVNTEDCLIGYGFTASSAQKKSDSKSLLEVYFDLPDDAKAGDTYEITFLTANSKALKGNDAITLEHINGWIKVEGQTTTSTTETTTTTTETTTSTSETTTSTVTTVSETETTASGSETTGSGSGTGTTASASGTAGSTTGSATSTTKKTNAQNPSTQKTQVTGNGGKKDGPTTGDAGVALALAGLLAAAGTAVAVRKKH